MDGLRNLLTTFASSYLKAKTEVFKGHELSAFMRKTVPAGIAEIGSFESEKYKVAGSVGKGTWAEIPWSAVFDLDETNTLHHGLFIIYVFSADMNQVYLSINQGSVTFFDAHNRAETNAFLIENAEKMVSSLGEEGLITGKIDLKATSHVGRFLELGNIYAKCYNLSDLPSDEVLSSDLLQFKSIYSRALAIPHPNPL